jgi:hypothetical protein
MPTFNDMLQHLFNTSTNSLHLNTSWHGSDCPVWGLNFDLSFDYGLVIDDHEQKLTKDEAIIKFEKTHYDFIWDLYMENICPIHRMTSYQYFNELCA